MAFSLKWDDVELPIDTRECERQYRADWLPPRPAYIHLRDARWPPLDENFQQGAGTLWRGKLSAVDGFSIAAVNRPERAGTSTAH